MYVHGIDKFYIKATTGGKNANSLMHRAIYVWRSAYKEI